MQKKFPILMVSIFALFLLQNYFSYNTSIFHQKNKQLYNKWLTAHPHQFTSQYQYEYRLGIFVQNKEKVQQHNKLADQGRYKYYMGLNRFADWTEEEYLAAYGHSLNKGQDIKGGLQANITTKCAGSISDAPNPPDTLNWTDKAVDKNVIDQKKCAANWAFSAVSAVQGLYSIKMEKFVKFSDQQVIDCSGAYGNQGCGGGFMDQAYWYMIDNGLASEKSYPLVQVSQNCKYSQSMKIAKLGKCAKVPSKNYEKLISAIVQQPVTVAVASTKFMLYERGIFDSQCGTDIDRGMLLVGYGTENEEDYWILKNSLGIAWGQRGYIRLKRTHQNDSGWCGIQLAASVPQNVQ